MSEIQHIKLSDLTKKIEEHIRQSFGTQLHWIVAEINGHKFYPNQDRHYFEFVEKIEGQNVETAKVRGIAWREGHQNIKYFEENTGQQFTNGLQVLVKVKVEFNSIHGFQLILLDIDQSFTLGNLEKQRRETLLKLVTDNPGYISKVGEQYITKNKKLKLNLVLQKIALIASPNSEGYNDFIHTIKNNQYGFKFHIDEYQSSVQGALAENELANTLVKIFESKINYDCVVIIRGGGSKTDFLVFDTYLVARYVARFPIPIITGIGHHKDVSITDLMANTVTKTPTKSAELIISHNRFFEESVLQSQKNIIIKSQQLLSHSQKEINALNTAIINNARNEINVFKDRLANFNQIVINKTKTILYNKQSNLINLLGQITSRPLMVINNKSKDLSHVISNLKLFSNKYMVNQNGYLGHYKSVVNLLSPAKTLRRGFAIISQKGKVLKDSQNIDIGSSLTITLSDSEINTTVNSKTKKDGNSNL